MQALFALFSSPPPQAVPLAPEDFDALDDLLDELRSREEDIPPWEFCEGFLAALVCSRRPIAPAEYLPVLLGLPEAEGEAGASFKDEAQARALAGLWGRRWVEVQTALDAEVESLDDERCYHPELLDQRAALQDLDEAERERFSLEDLPSFAQVWALGFMYAVESWPEDWAPPRDKEAADVLDSALGAIVALTEDDTGEPEIAPFGEGPATVSQDRVNDLADAIWAVYDLRALWRGLGPRIATVRAEATPGRNEPCGCGSGKKFKKCCGA